MIFIKRNGLVSGTSYYSYKFEPHGSRDVCVGDQVWSDGVNVEIYEGVDVDILLDLIDIVDNKQDFIEVLKRDGVL